MYEIQLASAAMLLVAKVYATRLLPLYQNQTDLRQSFCGMYDVSYVICDPCFVRLHQHDETANGERELGLQSSWNGLHVGDRQDLARLRDL
jgi:hypothetical protein